MQHVLVVEDDPVVLVAMTFLLEDLGYAVTAETTVAGGLVRLLSTQQQYAQIVLDHDLPDGKGTEVALVAATVQPSTPVTLHTASAPSGRPAGVSVVVPKTPGLSALLEVIPAAA